MCGELVDSLNLLFVRALSHHQSIIILRLTLKNNIYLTYIIIFNVKTFEFITLI